MANPDVYETLNICIDRMQTRPQTWTLNICKAACFFTRM